MKKSLLVLMGIFGLLLPLFAQTKYALVIGNGAYQNPSINALQNPVNDTNAVAAKLRQIGYTVDLKQNLTNEGMERAVGSFIERLSTHPDNEGFFWYAGHGVEVDGKNYLLPIDLVARDNVAIKHRSFLLNELLDLFDARANNKINVVVIDACRDNPLKTGGRSIGGERGLAVIKNVSKDVVILYSTAPGEKAEDGNGRQNSPFTEAFLKHVETNEPFSVFFAKTAAETLRMTGQRQRPYQMGSIVSNPYYSLNPAVGPSIGPTAQEPTGPKVNTVVETGSITVSTATAGTLEVRNGTGLVSSGQVGAGQTPIHNLTVGTYTIKMSYTGNQSETKTVTVRANGTAPVTFSYRAVGSLTATTVTAGTLQILSGSNSVVNQNVAAGSRTTVSDLQAGNYTVRMSYTGNQKEECNVTVSANGTATAAFTYAPQVASIAREYFDRGREYYKNGDIERSIADYTQAIRLNPNDAQVYNNRGAAYDDKGDYDRAIADYNQAIRLNPSYANAYYNRGNAYDDKGDIERAIADYTQAIRLNPNDAQAYNNRGSAYRHKGDIERAIADYTQAIRLNPNDAQAYNNRGNAYYMKKDYRQAIIDYTQTLKLDPNQVNAKKFLEEAKKRQRN